MNKTTQTVITSSITGDSCIKINHSSGLTIYVAEMEGFPMTNALFAAKYGSINTKFKTCYDDDYCTVPEGIAHFLEHKLFENEDCDVFSLYAKTGANGNAYTSFDKTCYLFQCSDHYKESLEILLSFVQDPYFTPESIQKELGIIGQEIRMTNDDPGWKLFFNMLKGLYHEHPVKIDIAGTESSIAQITDKLLYRCYNTFYNLHNMVLSVSGNCKADEILEIADRLLKPCENIKLESVFPDEPMTIVYPEISELAAVGTTMFCIGFKCAPKDGFSSTKAQIEAYIAAQVLTNASSDLYCSLIKTGLINNVFGSEIFNGEGYFAVVLEGESPDPYLVKEKIIETFEKAKETGLDAELFEEVRRSLYGAMIMDTNDVNSVANIMMSSHLNGETPFNTIELLSKVTIDDVNRFIREEIDTSLCTLSIVKSSNAEDMKGEA
ncbi:MAG: insulinase family protein [Ruminococcus sp.]|nr:insulinase family protein [Ruminococcus sp.]